MVALRYYHNVFTLCITIAFTFSTVYILNYLQTTDRLVPSPRDEKDEAIGLVKDDSQAIGLAKSIRILCLILVQPSTLYTNGQAVKDTWGKHCNILLFVSSTNDTKFGTFGVNFTEGRRNLWSKTRDGFKHVYEHYYDKADWFIKADDNTFVIVENLRYFLASYNTNDPHYFGEKWKWRKGEYFNAGGAGYVLSKKALKEFYHVMDDIKKCHPVPPIGSEDYYVAICLNSVNIYPGDTRDKFGRHTFHQFGVEEEYSRERRKDKFDSWEPKGGRECCSDYSISYHQVTVRLMYQLHYLIYKLKVYGNIEDTK